MREKITAIALCALMALGMTSVPSISFAADGSATPDQPAVSSDTQGTQDARNGRCGLHADWSLSDDGTLTISGTGELYGNYVPWENVKSSIKSVKIDEGITSLPGGAFSECKNLESVKFPDSMTEIMYMAFSGCSELKDFSVSDNIKKIGPQAFEKCKSLRSIYIPSNVESIGVCAFMGCINLKDITISSDSKARIGGGTFEGCSALEAIEIPSGVVFDYDVDPDRGIFMGCSSLKSVSIKASSYTRDFSDEHIIPSYMFASCTNLREFSIPSGIEYVDSWAFDGCTSLSSVKIPASVTHIEIAAFQNCPNLKNVNYLGPEILLEDLVNHNIMGGNDVIFDNIKSVYEPLNSIKLDHSELTTGSQSFRNIVRLSLVEPDIDYPAVKWTTSDPSVVKFREHNHNDIDTQYAKSEVNIVGLKEGTAIITVTDGTAIAKCKVTVDNSSDNPNITDNDNIPETFTVSFDGGIPSQTVKRGETAKRPSENPVRKGYTFAGWLDAANDKWDFSRPIYSNVYIYAKWKGNPVKVIYDLNGQGKKGALSTTTFDRGTKLDSDHAPSPSVPGYAFLGWYKDKACKEPFDFQTPYTGDADEFTLYAGWLKFADYSTNSGSVVENHIYNSVIAVPDNDHGKTTVKADNGRNTAVITTEPDSGYTVDTVRVIDKNGKEISVKKVSENHYQFTVPDGGAVVVAKYKKIDDSKGTDTDIKDNDKLFMDVIDQSQFYFKPVYWAVKKNIVFGTTPTLFSPDDNCSRAQIVTFIYRMMGSPSVSGNGSGFRDVHSDDYYYDAVRWAKSAGIVSGVAPYTFDPDGTCTRAQAMTFIWRAAGKPDAAGRSEFRDVGSNEYYSKAVTWAEKNGIAAGTSASTFSPNDPCSRGQIVTFLYRARNILK